MALRLGAMELRRRIAIRGCSWPGPVWEKGIYRLSDNLVHRQGLRFFQQPAPRQLIPSPLEGEGVRGQQSPGTLSPSSSPPSKAGEDAFFQVVG